MCEILQKIKVLINDERQSEPFSGYICLIKYTSDTNALFLLSDNYDYAGGWEELRRENPTLALMKCTWWMLCTKRNYIKFPSNFGPKFLSSCIENFRLNSDNIYPCEFQYLTFKKLGNESRRFHKIKL